MSKRGRRRGEREGLGRVREGRRGLREGGREGKGAPVVVEDGARWYLRTGGGLGRRSGALPHSLPRPPAATRVGCPQPKHVVPGVPSEMRKLPAGGGVWQCHQVTCHKLGHSFLHACAVAFEWVGRCSHQRSARPASHAPEDLSSVDSRRRKRNAANVSGRGLEWRRARRDPPTLSDLKGGGHGGFGGSHRP